MQKLSRNQPVQNRIQYAYVHGIWANHCSAMSTCDELIKIRRSLRRYRKKHPTIDLKKERKEPSS